MTKIAILSVAHMHAFSYCAALKRMADAEVCGVYDDHVTRAHAFAERTGLPVADDLDTLLEQSDAVIICAENANHLRYVQAAAKVGKPMLCEKPLSNDVDSGVRIMEAVQAANVPFYLSLPMRFVSSVQQARTVVHSGDIGRVVSMSGTNHGSAPGGWFQDRVLSGGGAVADHTPHVIDVMRWISTADVVEVYAEISSGNFVQGIDDSAILTMTWTDGTFSTLDPSWSRIQGVYPEWGDVTLELVGTQGVVSLDAFAQKADRYTADQPNHQFLHYGDNADFYLVKDFVSCVREGRVSDVLAGVEDGLHSLLVTQAAYQSAETGRCVSVKP